MFNSRVDGTQGKKHINSGEKPKVVPYLYAYAYRSIFKKNI